MIVAIDVDLVIRSRIVRNFPDLCFYLRFYLLFEDIPIRRIALVISQPQSDKRMTKFTLFINKQTDFPGFRNGKTFQEIKVYRES